MSFFGRVSKFFGIISVKTIGNKVRVTGIDALIMRKYIRNLWETDSINKHLILQASDTSFTFHQFFVPDMIYILRKLKESDQCSWGGKRSVERIVQLLESETWFRVSKGPVKSMIDPSRMKALKWKPLPKQAEFLHLYGELMPKYDLNGFILAMAPGGGKTFTDLLVVTCVIPPEVAEVKIVISPKKALHLVWEKSVRDLFVKAPTYWCSDSGKPMPESGCEYYLFNFEAIPKAIELGKKLLAKNIRYFVIVDETHNFADPRSNRTQDLVKLQTLRDQIFFIWTSGSPILKTAIELVSFLKCADRRFDDEAEKIFRKIYSVNSGRAGEIFNHRLGLMMAFIVAKSEFSPTKPKVVERPVKLPKALADKFLMESVREEMKEFIKIRLKEYEGKMKDLRRLVDDNLKLHEAKLNTRFERREYDKYLKNLKIISRNPDLMLREVLTAARTYERRFLIPSLPSNNRKEFRSALSAVKNIKLKVRGEALGKILSKRRSECAAALAYYCKPEEIMNESLSKTLFFASSVLPIQVLNDYLDKRGFNPMMVFGGTNSQLTQIMEQFEADPNLNPVCATMQSLSEAVPVTAASTVVLLNRPFRQATWDQVVARADRLGQKHPVTVIEVTLDTGDKPNVSSTTDAILGQVRELINELVGPDFAGPDPDEREYQNTLDASEADPDALESERKLDL